jgi:hypothetical protein
LLDIHFTPFFNIQQKAIEIISQKVPKSKFLDEYHTLFPDLTTNYFNREKFFEQIQPVLASN